ncbi:NAD(P)-dependent alcohol dehydrogenase [Salinisphaera sp. SPP-AMP-43]|uniref:NAD(P)-dependent alcohol dehydrogenase n=1 Tax=Salinisphaera sp. SPP-AMP-43 TaxID=3121288 RepID=UPI003C6E9526
MPEASLSRQIRAAITPCQGAPFEMRTLHLRAPRADEVRVRVVATGLCHTDLIVRDQLYPVPLPAVLGHEGAGVVEAVGPSVTTVAPGDHVVMSYGYCGRCRHCYEGAPSYCGEFFERNFGGSGPDGGHALSDEHGRPVHDHFFSQSSFATYALCRQSNAIRVPKAAPLALLGPLGCGIQTGAGAIMNALAVSPMSRVAIFGAGAVGQSAIMAARVMGAAEIIAVDRRESRLTLARELGATQAIDATYADPVEAICQLTGSGVDYALESTGNTTVLRQAIESLDKRGVIGVVGAPPLGEQSAFDVNDLLVGGKQIRGIVEGDSVAKTFIPALVDLHLRGRFPFDQLVRYYDFEDINQAAADSENGRTLKPILTLDAP